MNVTQVTQSAVNVKSKGKETEINSEEFSKAFEKLTASSNQKKHSEAAVETETDERKKGSSESKEKSEKETEPATFTLINPFLNLDADIKDLKSLGKSFIIHTEPSTTEASHIPVDQIIISDTEMLSMNKDAVGISGELAESLTQEQLAVLTSLTDADQVIEGKTISEVVKEVNKLMETASSTKTVESETESKKQNSEASINQSSSTDRRESTVKELKQTLHDLQRADSDSKVNNQQSANENGSENLATEKSEGIKLSSEKIPLIAEGSKEKPALETIKQSELNTLETEHVDKTTSEGKAKETASQADTDYDFVSLMRQLSSQSTKQTSQANIKPSPEANVPVPKEQGMNLIQDMVTTLVENKEGQKTYQTTLHLTPETLGKVTVELSFNEDGLSGKLTFQSDEARRWMEGEWLDLKLPLESKGLNIKSFDFTTSQPATQQQNAFSFSEQSNQSGQDSQNHSQGRNGSASLTETEEPTAEASKNETNGLNVYV